MASMLEDHDIKNSSWIGIFLLVTTILMGFLFIWFWSILTTQALDIEYVEEDENAAVTAVSDERPVVQVANATNQDGLAGEATRRLQSRDFVGLSPFNIDNQPTSAVYFKTDGVPRQTQAEQIGNIFSIEVVEPFPEDREFAQLDPEAELLVIIGPDADLG